MQQNGKRAALVWAALAIPVIWFAVLAAQCCGPGVGLLAWINAMNEAMQTPFQLDWTPYTKKAICIALAVYGFGVAWYYAERGNRRPGEEHGSARWDDAKVVCAHFRTKKQDRYLLISKHIRISMNTRALPQAHQVNANIICIGGSGAGKTRYFILPNLLEANCSYIVCDPKGETYRFVAGALERMGYEVLIFNLVDMSQSDGYNPFRYLHRDTDAIKLVNIIIKNTKGKDAQTNDPFWEQAETALLSAIILFLMHEAPESEQNFGTVLYLLENCEVQENDENYRSPVDLLFEDLERIDPYHIAVSQWKIFKMAGGKTAKSILICAGVRLAAFNLRDIQQITSRDDMKLGAMGDRKRVIFAVIPDNDTSFNYLVGMLYTQAFQELYFAADNQYGGRLPIPVRVMMDEFANVALPEDFERILSTCRSREISISIVLQNLAQIKALFKDSWENLTGNCDTMLYLGGNEQSTHEYISKSLGKATIDTRTRGVTKGRSGSSSTNFQNTGRELMTPDEVRMLSNRKALIFIRGEHPVMDDKYPLKRHPNYRYSAGRTKKPYQKRFDIPDYARHDLPRPLDVEHIEIIESEGEIHHEQQRENPVRTQAADPARTTALLRLCQRIGALLRACYTRFRCRD